METTYYLKRIPTYIEKLKICQYINNNDVDMAKRELEKCDNTLKLGVKENNTFKFFLHDYNYYEPSRKSLVEFAKEKYIVEDENHVRYSINEFFHKIVDKCTIATDVDKYGEDSKFHTKNYSPFLYSYWTDKNYAINSYGELFNDDLCWTISQY